ncbi:MAG: glycosyltransferase [Chloroflexi bacterium]|nr:glycosyltransferase [Chloroflexota bacterium]
MRGRAGRGTPRGRILILDENLPVPFDRRVWLEATTLRDAGYTVSVICPKGEGDYRESRVRLDGIDVYRFSVPRSADGFIAHVQEYAVAMAAMTLLTLRVWQRHGFDAIHACNPPDLLFAIGALFKPFGVKFVFDQHDLTPELFRVQFGGRFPGVIAALRGLEWLTFKTADRVLATNESLKELANRRGGVPLDRISVVRTGPDFERLRRVPAGPELRRGKRFLVAYVGVMGQQDGVDLAIHAAQRVIHDFGRHDVHFTFIGAGDHVSDLRRLAGDLGLDEDVEFTGRISDADLIRYLSTADVCLSPDPANGFNELHTMTKTMEYMALGRPVVAFDLRETRYSAQDAALYAPPNDVDAFAAAIVRLLEDEGLRARLGAAGRERVEHVLAWDHTRQALLAAYECLLGDGQATDVVISQGVEPATTQPESASATEEAATGGTPPERTPVRRTSVKPRSTARAPARRTSTPRRSTEHVEDERDDAAHVETGREHALQRVGQGEAPGEGE